MSRRDRRLSACDEDRSKLDVGVELLGDATRHDLWHVADLDPVGEDRHRDRIVVVVRFAHGSCGSPSS
ncbi:hypothetical protein C5E05_00810 [Pseudoclavibacter sp. AY1H1]|nr:hypothetical protein C5E05_00810 [Pseudoclavibacter sp. AY1H1]